MIDEMKDRNYTLVASNDTQIKKRGTFRVFDIETDETFFRCGKPKQGAGKTADDICAKTLFGVGMEHGTKYVF